VIRLQFIAEDPVHVVVRNESPALIDAKTGRTVRLAQRRLFAKFQRGTAPEWAQKIALETFEFRRCPRASPPASGSPSTTPHEAAGSARLDDEERDRDRGEALEPPRRRSSSRSRG
jgi:hypothetical protein